jgi:hypothetical protein
MTPDLVSLTPAVVAVAGVIAAAIAAARLARPLQPVRVKAARGGRRR